MTIFGARVREARLSRGLTQSDVVKQLAQLGVPATQGYLSLIESGSRKEPKVDKIIALSLLLDISLDEIIFTERDRDDQF